MNIHAEALRTALAVLIHRFWAADVLSFIDDQNSDQELGIEIETGQELGRPTVFIKMPRTLFENIDRAARCEFKDLPPNIQARFRVTAGRMMKIVAGAINGAVCGLNYHVPGSVTCVVCGEVYPPGDPEYTPGMRCVCGNLP